MEKEELKKELASHNMPKAFRQLAELMIEKYEKPDQDLRNFLDNLYEAGEAMTQITFEYSLEKLELITETVKEMKTIREHEGKVALAKIADELEALDKDINALADELEAKGSTVSETPTSTQNAVADVGLVNPEPSKVHPTVF